MTDRPADRSRPETPGWQDVWLLTVAVIFGLVLVFALFGAETTRFDEVGLGEGTVSRYQTHNGRQIHCRSIATAADCLADQASGTGRAKGTWLGWSQIHGVNGYQDGQRLSPWLMVDGLKAQGADLMTFSFANANPRELYLTYLHLQEKTPQDFLIWGAWLQGFYHEGVRDDIAATLRNDDVARELARTEVGRAMLSRWGPADPASGYAGAAPDQGERADTADASGKVQRLTEASIVEWLESRFDLFKARREAEGQLQLLTWDLQQIVLRVRNFILGLDTKKWQWVIPPARYALNLQATEAVLQDARRNGTRVLVYVPPRPVEHPFRFDAAVYTKFKREIEDLAARHGAAFVNLEDAVPGGYRVWGKTVGGDGALVMDGTHFTAEGHALLADALLDALTTHGVVPRPKP